VLWVAAGLAIGVRNNDLPGNTRKKGKMNV
jgi:hypothetical protein